MEVNRTVVSALTASLVIAIMVSTPVRANDTMAVLGAGGLELTTSKDIVMASEDLYLSSAEVRVRYIFRNESDRDITARVAFPLPDISFEPDYNVDLPDAQDDNFVGFSVTVDGQPVKPALEQRAISNPVGFEGQAPVVLKAGIDITAKVLKAGLPINANLPSWKEKVEALLTGARQRLVKQGLLSMDMENDGSGSVEVAYPNWSLRETYHWEQTFPAGKTITVDHRYKPVTGGSIFYGESQIQDYKHYCLDDQGKSGLRRLLKQPKADPQGADGIPGNEVSYILHTGANWKGPIEDFHLTIDKGKPTAILSLCMSGLKKTGPTTFEVRRTNFTPKEDIRFVVFEGP